MGDNVLALTRHRESPESHMPPLHDADRGAARRARWDRNMQAARLYDEAHARFMWGQSSSYEFRAALQMLEAHYPEYAPGRFLKAEHLALENAVPRLVASEAFALLTPEGDMRTVEISAVQVRVGDSRGTVLFVDNEAREIYGQRYQNGSSAELDVALPAFAGEVLAALRDAYDEETATSTARGLRLPPAAETLDRLRAVVAEQTTGGP